MSNIDYKKEVLLVHPNAQSIQSIGDGTYSIWAYLFREGYTIYDNNAMTEIGAWYFAYETLKKEGKIK